MPSRVFVSLLLVVLASCTPGASTTTTSARRERDVVVLLVVDQLAGWIAQERFPLLPPGGGFARLVRGSGGLRLLEHGHSVTDTAPGHAALFTGKLPRDHRIGANEMVAPNGRPVSILRDEATHLVAPSGPSERPGSSLAALRGDTVADRLRSRSANAHIVALSLKDRAALFAGGRTPSAVLYFDPTLNSFVTSSAFATEFPAWAAPIVSDMTARESTPWTMLDEEFVRAHATVPDDARGEGNLGGFGTTFPHTIDTTERPGYAFRSSPASDVALVDLALAAAGSIPDDDAPVLLAVSFSANDYVGHVFGPSSFEAWDTLRRLDGELSRLLAGLDARFGEGGYSVVLSADHGVFEMPEEDIAHASWCPGPDPFERPCSRAFRLDPDGLAARLERAADSELGAGEWVLGVADPYVRLTPAADSLEPARHERLLRRLVDTIRDIPGFADALVTSDPHACEGVRHPEPTIFCAAILPELGAIYLVPMPGAFYDSSYVPGFGSGHGSPMRYDRRVPFLVVRSSMNPDVSELLGAPGSVVRFDSYFSIADRFLGGDGVP